jgi:hypothetical protein
MAAQCNKYIILIWCPIISKTPLKSYISPQDTIKNLSPTVPVKDEKSLVFALSRQKSLFLELLNTLAIILNQEPVEYLLFLMPLLKNYTSEQIIEKLDVNYQMYQLLEQDNENINHEVDQLYKLLSTKEAMKQFIATHGLSKKFFDYSLKSLVISKNLIIQNFFKEAYYCTNYDLSDINTHKIFTSKKVYYVYFIEKKSQLPGLLKKTNVVIKNPKMAQLIHSLNQKAQPLIVKNFFQFSFLNPGEFINNTIKIKNKSYYRVVICREFIEEKINNTLFNFMEIKFKSPLDSSTLENIFNPLNKLNTKEIFLFINKIFKTHGFTHVKFETFYDQTVESIINNPEILDVVVNFGPKKYLLINGEDGYVLYLIFHVNTTQKSQLSVKPMKYIMDYILKNLS